MRYIILARTIRAFLHLGIILMSIGVIRNIYGEVLNKKKYWQFGDFIVGEKVEGFSLPMRLRISIPDTIITFKGLRNNGVVKRYANTGRIFTEETFGCYR